MRRGGARFVSSIVIPDGREADPGPRGHAHRPWVPALRYAAAGMTMIG